MGKLSSLKKKRVSSKVPDKVKKKIESYNKYIKKLENKLMNLSFHLGDYQMHCDLREELYVNSEVPAAILAAMAKAPAKFAFWSLLYDDILNYEASEVLTYDLFYNKHYVDLIVQDDYRRASDSRVERIIAVEQNKEYVKWRKHFNEINKVKSKLKIVIKAYEHKMDMLRSIGAMVRVDRGYQPGT